MTISVQEVWSELDHKFEKDGAGNLKKASNIDAVKSSIANIIGTRQGQRVMLPSFAEIFTNFLFDPIDLHLSSYLSDQVKETIEIWDDRVTVVNTDFKSDPDRNQVSITIQFVIKGYQDIFSITQEI